MIKRLGITKPESNCIISLAHNLNMGWGSGLITLHHGGGKMATYILLSNVTDEGAKTLKNNPARIKEVNKELENFGVKVLSQFAVLGPFDFVNIVEGPDNLTMMRVAAELGARGSVKIMTLPAVSIDDFISRFK